MSKKALCLITTQGPKRNILSLFCKNPNSQLYETNQICLSQKQTPSVLFYFYSLFLHCILFYLHILFVCFILFQIPEVPTLSNNIQKFVKANINYNAQAISSECTRNNTSQDDKDISQQSSHPGIYSANMLQHMENRPQRRKSPVSSTSPSIAARTDLNNDRCVADNSTQNRKAVDEIWHNSENSKQKICTFHQVLLNAKNMNQLNINKLK